MEYGNFLRRELPPIVRREIDSTMAGAFEAPIRDQIISLVQGLHTKLFAAFRESFVSGDISRSSDSICHKLPVSTEELQTPSPELAPEPPNIFSDLDILSSGSDWPFNSCINFPLDPSELAVFTEEVSATSSKVISPLPDGPNISRSRESDLDSGGKRSFNQGIDVPFEGGDLSSIFPRFGDGLWQVD